MFEAEFIITDFTLVLEGCTFWVVEFVFHLLYKLSFQGIATELERDSESNCCERKSFLDHYCIVLESLYKNFEPLMDACIMDSLVDVSQSNG